jgi:WbqC-like protein family
MRVVISQSMLFPWVGMLEQIRLADVFVHYDDVQFSKGSFVNRVQVKTQDGMRWMTLPLEGLHLGQRIDAVRLAPAAKWRDRHLDLLRASFSGSPFATDALRLAEEVFSAPHTHLGSLARASTLALAHYFGLDSDTRFIDVGELGVAGASSDRVLEVVQRLGGDVYVTGHGARNYLNHRLFEESGIAVEYMQYRCDPYAQTHGAFTPYVTGLDLVANCGRAGVRHIMSRSIDWRQFANEPA